MGNATITVGLVGSTITVQPSTLSMNAGNNNDILWTIQTANATIIGFNFSSNWSPNPNPTSVGVNQYTVDDANGFGNSNKSFTYTITCANASGTTSLDPEIVNNATGPGPGYISSPPGSEDRE